MKTLVMKFGGASLETPAHFSQAAALIREKKESDCRLVIVVSAMKGMTDQLLTLAESVSKAPPKREVDMLLSVGERVSMSLLAMALEKEGIPAISLTGSQSGIITCNRHSEALIKEVRPTRIIEQLDQGKVVIVAGFQGVSTEKEITTLGRGGSDTTAVALGVALGAKRVEFYKDVKGIYSEDPKKMEDAELFRHLTFQQALILSPKVLHERAILLASKNGLPLHVISYCKTLRCSFPGTEVGGEALQEGPVYEVDDRDHRSPSREGSAGGYAF